MVTPVIFVVSDDAAVGDSIKDLVESAGLRAENFPSLRAFLDAVEPGRRGCLVFDAHVGDLRDRQRQTRLAVAYSRIPVILLTDRGDVAMAVHAVKTGARDVVEKPYRDKNLLDSINRVMQEDAAARS